MWLLSKDPIRGNLPYQLKGGTHILGRSARCDVIIAEPSISRTHARLVFCRLGAVMLEDMSSTNGTFIGEMRIERFRLVPGSTFCCGSVGFELVETPPFLDDADGLESTPLEDDVAYLRVSLAASLTKAQQRVLALLLKGMQEKEIARRLNNSRNTVHHHVQAIYETHGVHSRSELLAKILGLR
jgi:DNA-binding CsgD family transcriptional regulator